MLENFSFVVFWPTVITVHVLIRFPALYWMSEHFKIRSHNTKRPICLWFKSTGGKLIFATHKERVKGNTFQEFCKYFRFIPWFIYTIKKEIYQIYTLVYIKPVLLKHLFSSAINRLKGSLYI